MNKFSILSLFLLIGTPASAQNVLFIAVDDLRPQIAAYGQPQMITPNIDRLASQGRLFNRHYCQVPTCGASRYSMMIGRRVATPLNSAFDQLQRDSAGVLSPNSLPQAFRMAGYTTLGIGKLSHVPDGGGLEMPLTWDESYMTSGIWGSPWNAFFAYAGGATRIFGVSPRTEIGVQADGKTSLLDTDYPDGLMAVEAVARLNEFAATGERFFFGIGFFKPHLPFCAPKNYWDKYDRESMIVPKQTTPNGVNLNHVLSGNGEVTVGYGGPDEIDDAEAKLLIHGYYACVSYIDAQIGMVLDALENTGLAENTVVVLWSDHGWHLGEQTAWGKHTPLEEALKSTLIIRVPNQPLPGAETLTFSESIDLFPTLTELCGVLAPATLDGVSLAPAIAEPAEHVKDFGLSFWKKSQNIQSIRTEQYRLIRYGNNPTSPAAVYLFDYFTDPEGKQNVADEYPEVVESLLDRITELGQ